MISAFQGTRNKHKTTALEETFGRLPYDNWIFDYFESARSITTTHDAGLTRPPLSYVHVRNARLSRYPSGVLSKTRHFHECCGHMSKDSMCMALTTQSGFESPIFINAPVDVAEIRKAFRHEPCLICVLAKRRKEGTLHWIKKAAGNPRSKLRLKLETDEELVLIKRQLILDQRVKIGEIPDIHRRQELLLGSQMHEGPQDLLHPKPAQ